MSPRDWLLAELRCASLRSRLVTAEIDEIGLALKHNLISPEVAVQWLHDVGLGDVLPQHARAAA